MNNRTNLLVMWTLTGVRVLLGIFWLSQITWKPPPTFGCPNDGFCFWLDQEIAHPVIPLFANLLRTVIRPNAILFGWVATFTEVSVGLTLVFGFFTRLSALVGTMWALNLLIGLAGVPNEQPWYYGFMVMFDFLFIALGGSGQFSIDRSKGWQIWFARAGTLVIAGK